MKISLLVSKKPFLKTYQRRNRSKQVINILVADPTLDIPLPSTVDRRITTRAEYVPGYVEIAEAIHKNEDLVVLVTDPAVGRWLNVMAQKYGPKHITIEELTPRSIFIAQTGISHLPSQVTNKRLLESRLLELKIPATPGIAFEDYVLEVFFGSFLVLQNGLRRVNDIISVYEPEQWQESLQRPLVRDIYQERIRLLRQQLSENNQHADIQLLNWIDDSPQEYIRSLFVLKVLTSYPEAVGKRVLGEIFPALVGLKLDLRRVPSVISGNEELLNEVELFLKQNIEKADDKTLELLLGYTSGYLEVEFDAVHNLLTSGKYETSANLIRSIKTKFRTLASSPRIGQSLSDLDLMIKREPPGEPNESWGIEEWIKWAEQEYLPYRYWLENTGQLDDEIGKAANAYAEWLFNNYGQLLYNSDYMSWKALLKLRDRMKEHNGPVLIVIVDNFNSKFYGDLQAQMQHQGFYEHQVQSCISLLPSCTEVSKRALIIGHYSPMPGTSYRKQVEETWSNRLGKEVYYLSSVSALRKAVAQQNSVYFLNYLALDITLHLNEDQTGISHTQTIRNHLSLLSRDIRSFAQRSGAERDLMVIFVSDHGSTRIPKDTVNVIDSKFYKDRATDEHHRYIAISEDELNKLPDNSQYDCYLFKKERYDLDKNYLVARRLYRFLPTQDHAYVHGGLTPEETLVPLAIYQPATITPKPPTILLASGTKIYVGTKTDLKLEVTNTNNYVCNQVTITFVDPNIEAEPITIQSISQLERQQISIPARCPQSANASSKSLKAMLNFQFLGQTWEFELNIPAEFAELAKPKFDLDNL